MNLYTVEPPVSPLLVMGVSIFVYVCLLRWQVRRNDAEASSNDVILFFDDVGGASLRSQ